MHASNTKVLIDEKAKSKQINATSKLGAQQMVHWFVASSYASSSFTEERVKNSVALLHRVPSARNAVLHRFTMLYEEAIRASLDQMEFPATAIGLSSEMTSSLELVTTTLFDLLNENGEAWASILCSWSVESLGQISSCYKQRQVIPPPTNLSRLLSFWLNLVPMRMLLDVYRTSLNILIQCNVASCLDSLLSASSNHSPYFDWVVADIGNAFPNAVIERVLNTGFSKFCKLRWTSISITPSSSITMNESEQSILTSVIRILEHLATFHQTQICEKMLEMFKTPPADKSTGQIKIVFFLMRVFSASIQLLHATTNLFVNEINATTLNQLHKQFKRLSKGPEEMESLCSLVVHLVCQSSTGSYSLVNLMIAAASHDSQKIGGLEKSVKDIFSNILPSILKDLQHLALSKQSEDKETNNVFFELSNNYPNLCKDIITTSSDERKKWLHSVLLSVCLNHHASHVLSHLLIESTTAAHLEIFLKLFNDVKPFVPELTEKIVIRSFTAIKQMPGEKSLRLLINLYHLTSQTGSGLVSDNFVTRMTHCLCIVLDELVSMLGHLSSSQQIAFNAVQLLYIILSSVSSYKIKLDMRLMPLTQTLVFYFYKLLHTGHVNNDQAMQCCQRTLVQLSQTPELFAVVCRFVLEASVSQENSILFGRRVESNFSENESHSSQDLCTDHHVSLLSMHRKLSAQTISRRCSSVAGFVPISIETGMVGSGPKQKKKCPISKVAQTSNNESLSLLLYRCCCKTTSGTDISHFSIPDVAQAFDAEKLSVLSTSLLSAIMASSPYLATAITLDGEPEWPSNQVKKFTIERDLKVFHFMDEHPFAWQLLSLVAHNYRSLWNLSPILRSCISVLIFHFEASRYNEPPSETSLHYQVALQVIQIARKGQLIPPPLCFVNELFHIVTEYEINVLMVVVWNFIKDYPPPLEGENNEVPVTRNFEAEGINLQPYLATIHTILHANIDKLGHMFSRFTMQS
ncbi:unnamed protein product [Clavelina lepadiformis]|uniref:Integrator complex subunit 5 n=1 Tax=Clavelina lepadiformis TaxID=159417 RepID=A0ABP0FXU6_CLALP